MLSGSVEALVVAAGSGTRLGGLPKQYRALAGTSLLKRTIIALQQHPRIRQVQVVINPEHKEYYLAATQGLDLLPPVAGGATRQESVLRGLEAMDNPDIVLIHDAARPFVSIPLIDRVIAALEHHPGAIPALPVVDSLRLGNDVISGEVSRDGLWRAQTPQGFHFAAILSAHQQATREFTDDAAVAHAAELAVALVEGDEEAFKVTTAQDWQRAEQHLVRHRIPRTGMGFDVHRFGPNADGSRDHIWLCGITIPHSDGLVGHSDADVGLHALTDAVLGALGQGDIGEHFPPSDPQWRGAPSWKFLDHARLLAQRAGAIISHVDITIICERPKVGPHRAAMRARIAELLAIPENCVSVKATTTEGLGFTGRGEGIAAQAIATIMVMP